MRILIIGAGIAGLTLAALLRQRGLAPTLVDRAATLEGGGYALGLCPLGGRISTVSACTRRRMLMRVARAQDIVRQIFRLTERPI